MPSMRPWRKMPQALSNQWGKDFTGGWLLGRMEFSSVHSVICKSLQPHGLQNTRLPCHHQLPELSQIHVHQVSDAIQPSHPLLSPSPPAFNLSQNQGLSNESALHIKWPKDWNFSCSITPSNEYSELISFRMDWLVWSACSPRDS